MASVYRRDAAITQDDIMRNLAEDSGGFAFVNNNVKTSWNRNFFFIAFAVNDEESGHIVFTLNAGATVFGFMAFRLPPA